MSNLSIIGTISTDIPTELFNNLFEKFISDNNASFSGFIYEDEII